MNKKIVIDARMINDSGIGAYLKNILPFFIQNFKVVLLGNSKELSTFKNYGDCEIKEFNYKIYSLKEQLVFPFIVPKSDVFWAPHFNSPLFPIKSKIRIATIHDVNHLAFKGGVSILKKAYAKILLSNTTKKSKKIITVSNFSKNEILKYLNVNEDKLVVIYNGVSKTFFEEKKPYKNNSLPKKYFLFVGNVKPHKNLILLLEAYLNLPIKIKEDYKLIVLGKKKGFITPDKKVFNFIKENNLKEFVFFTGYVEEEFVSDIYAKASLFIFPSLYEGFGLPLLEAMASKTPVLSSERASLPEIGRDGVMYFNPISSNDLSQKIITLLKDDRLKETLIKKGYKYAKEFPWEKTAEKHIDLFKNVLSKK